MATQQPYASKIQRARKDIKDKLDELRYSRADGTPTNADLIQILEIMEQIT